MKNAIINTNEAINGRLYSFIAENNIIENKEKQHLFLITVTRL